MNLKQASSNKRPSDSWRNSSLVAYKSHKKEDKVHGANCGGSLLVALWKANVRIGFQLENDETENGTQLKFSIQSRRAHFQMQTI